MQIDPTSITNFKRTDSELEAFWLFCMFVAGKNSDYASACLARLLKGVTYPFDHLAQLGETGIHNALVAARVGQYSRLTKGVSESLWLDLRKASLDDLLNIHGVGPKTARFFLLHTRENCEYAVLDTHILKWLKSVNVDHNFTSTPSKAADYERLEKMFVNVAQAHYPQMSMAHIDLMIWSKMSGRL